MKFAIFVVMFALALGAQASVLPWGWANDYGHGHSYTAISGPGVVNGAAVIAHDGHHVIAHDGHTVIAHHEHPVIAHDGHTVLNGAAVITNNGAAIVNGAAVISHGGPILAHGHALGLGVGHAAVVSHAPAAVVHHASAAIVSHVPAAVVAHPIAHEGHYVAKTRGAVHTAPLAGHINSAASINVQPAPGTI